MANLLIIKKLIKDKNLTIREVASDIGMTEQGFQKLIRENSTKVETLEAIAKRLNVSVSIFFNEVQNDNKEPLNQSNLVESQQRTIENLSETIKNLTSK